MNKSLVKAASAIFPNQIVSFAYNQLTSPQVKKLRAHELEVLDQAQKETLPFGDFSIQLYTWAGGPDQVLLIHGWEGQAGNFADLVDALRAKNYTVHAFDGPSHGFSSKGKTSLFEFNELVGVLIKRFKASKLVSHSFGGVATTYSLYNNPDIHIDKYLMLTTPDRFSERINDVAQFTGISEKVKQRLIAKLEQETGVAVTTMNVSDFVKQINVKQGLIIHDEADRIIPIERAKNVQRNWPNSKFVTVQGTGHFRILRTQAVIEQVVNFLAN